MLQLGIEKPQVELQIEEPSIEITVAGVKAHIRGMVDAQSLGTVLDCLLARR